MRMVMLLSDILRVFSLPIKEEQAWAICYFSAKILSDYVEKGIKVNQLCETTVGVDESGRIRIQTSSSRDGHEHGLSESELIESLGVLLVKALNYGLHPDHPLSISGNLDTLLLHMTSTLSNDEGVVACSTLSFEDVVHACAGRISNDLERCDSHYSSVCNGMVAEAKELLSFLDVVGNSSDNENSLQRGDWARIWLSLMSELRNGGVKLKHLEQPHHTSSHHYELTPFEVLLADIRTQRYRLNQVMVNGEIPQAVRKNAETVILDFIKSRPLLRAAPINTGKKFVRPATARELLMTAIRNNEFQLRPTPPTTLSTLHSHKNSSSTSSSSSSHHHRRKVIRIDRSRISADSDPEDECSTNSSTPTAPNPNVPVASDESIHMTNLIINPQIKKLRTVAMTRSRSLSPPPEVGARLDRLSKQHTVVEQCASPVESEPDVIQMENPSTVSQKSQLTFEELARIRSVLTAAELEQLAVCPSVQGDVAAGRVCFACRKVRFNIIHWAIRCRLCGWNVCQKCTLPAVSLPGFERGVPVCCDCNELLEMINNPRSPASSLSPSESTIQNANVDPPSSRRLSNDQRCV